VLIAFTAMAVSWPAVGSAYLAGYEIEFRPTSVAIWQGYAGGFGATGVAIPTGEPTAFRVRAQARSGAESGWREALVPAAASLEPRGDAFPEPRGGSNLQTVRIQSHFLRKARILSLGCCRQQDRNPILREVAAVHSRRSLRLDQQHGARDGAEHLRGDVRFGSDDAVGGSGEAAGAVMRPACESEDLHAPGHIG